MSKWYMSLLVVGIWFLGFSGMVAAASCDKLAGVRNGIWIAQERGDAHTCRYKVEALTTYDSEHTKITISFSSTNHPRLCKRTGTIELTGTCSGGILTLNDGFTGKVSSLLLNIDGPNDNPQGYFYSA